MPKQDDQKNVQIEWIIGELKKGKERADILQKFTNLYNLKTKTFDNRLKEARERYKDIRERNKEANDRKLEEDPEWANLRNELLETKKLIYKSISHIIYKTKETVVNPKTGEKRTVLGIDMKDKSSVKNLKTLSDMVLTGLGEPTTISNNKNENNNLNQEIVSPEYTKALNNLAKAIKNKKKT